MKELQHINIGNGTVAVDFRPNDNRPAAVVDLLVLQRLTSLLGTANIAEIKLQFIASLEEVTSIEEYAKALSNELAFQTSVNLITQFKPEKESVQPLSKS